MLSGDFDQMICCVTGHRSCGFPFSSEDRESHLQYKKRLYEAVQDLLDQGFRHFITGMAEGVDTDFAIAVLFYKKQYEDIRLEAALPYPPQQRYADQKTVKEKILSSCDDVTVVSDKYYTGCMQKRNCYMVDRASLVLAVWNGEKKGGTWNTIAYARQKHKPIRYIMLDEPEQMKLF